VKWTFFCYIWKTINIKTLKYLISLFLLLVSFCAFSQTKDVSDSVIYSYVFKDILDRDYEVVDTISYFDDIINDEVYLEMNVLPKGVVKITQYGSSTAYYKSSMEYFQEDKWMLNCMVYKNGGFSSRNNAIEFKHHQFNGVDTLSISYLKNVANGYRFINFQNSRCLDSLDFKSKMMSKIENKAAITFLEHQNDTLTLEIIYKDNCALTPKVYIDVDGKTMSIRYVHTSSAEFLCECYYVMSLQIASSVEPQKYKLNGLKLKVVK